MYRRTDPTTCVALTSQNNPAPQGVRKGDSHPHVRRPWNPKFMRYLCGVQCVCATRGFNKGGRQYAHHGDMAVTR
ncbi:MAG: hypothetical protein QOH91_4249 [Mycobacterium sp.]|jgi:hypothetical protein|nr:hypothetical protein [Mycobacterium sp.]